MEATAPPRLSGLAEELLLRRPPSLRELATLVGRADDYSWFAGLVRRLFPTEAETVLSAPDVGKRVARWAELFGERHFPLHAGYLEYYLSEDDEPPCTVLRRGIPYGLLGFGYEGLHEMWDGYRDGISAMALLAKPPDTYIETDGIRVAWLESAAARIPQDTLLRIPEGGIPLDVLKETLKGTRFEGAAGAGAWVWAQTGIFPSTTRTKMGSTTASPTPGRTRSSRRPQESGPRPMRFSTRWTDWSTGWRRTCPAASPRWSTSSWLGSPINTRRKRKHEQRTR